MRPKQHSILGYCLTVVISVLMATLINYFWLPRKEVKHTLPTPMPSFERQIETFIAQNPSFLVTAMRQSLEEEKKVQEIKQKTAIKHHARDLYNFQSYPYMGNPEADVQIVFFFDYQCGYCKTFSKELQNLIASDPHVMVIFRDLPLFGPLSTKLSLLALAMNEQGKYLSFQEALMKETTPLTLSRAFEIATSLGADAQKLKDSMNDASLKKKISDTQALAQALDIHQTPSFILDDEVIAGALPQKMLEELISLWREQRKPEETQSPSVVPQGTEAQEGSSLSPVTTGANNKSVQASPACPVSS